MVHVYMEFYFNDMATNFNYRFKRLNPRLVNNIKTRSMLKSYVHWCEFVFVVAVIVAKDIVSYFSITPSSSFEARAFSEALI